MAYGIRCSGGLRFLLAPTLGSVAGGLRGPNILSRLIHVSFWRLDSLWVILRDVLDGQQRPAYEVSCFDGFHPG